VTCLAVGQPATNIPPNGPVGHHPDPRCLELAQTIIYNSEFTKATTLETFTTRPQLYWGTVTAWVWAF